MTEHGNGTAGAPDLTDLRDGIARIEARIAEEAADLTTLREELEALQAELNRSLSGEPAPSGDLAGDASSDDDDDDDLFDDVPV
jgi:hypothetical protein